MHPAGRAILERTIGGVKGQSGGTNCRQGLGAAHPFRLKIIRPRHPLPVFVVLAEDHQHVLGAVQSGRFQITIAREDNRLHFRVGSGRGIAHLSAQAVTAQAAAVGINIGQVLQVDKGGFGAIGGIESGIIFIKLIVGVAPPEGIQRDHHETPPGQLNPIGVGGLAVVLVTMQIDHSGCGGVHRRIGRLKKLSAHGQPVLVNKGHIANFDREAAGHGGIRAKLTDEHYDDAGNQQPSRRFPNLLIKHKRRHPNPPN